MTIVHMATIDHVIQFLEEFAPPKLAAEWDNVGLLIGDRSRQVQRIMTCLTVTPASVTEAIDQQVELIVTHHPVPFRPLKRITTDTLEGSMLWDLMNSGITVYSPHTAFDSTRGGINEQLAEGLGLSKVRPLIEGSADEPEVGIGRMGQFRASSSLGDLVAAAKGFLNVQSLQVLGDPGRTIEGVAVACGSGGEFVQAAADAGCDCLVTGEARFHTCLEAEALGLALILTGHYASERFAVERLAETLARKFADLAVWASRQERDSLRWI